MRIALLTDGISPYVTGGMQRHSYHLARHFLKLGVELTLIHCVGHDDDIPDEAEVAALLEAPDGMLRVLGFQFPKAGALPGHYLRESYRYSCQVYESLQTEWRNFDFIYSKGYTAWCLLEHKQKGQHMAPVGVKFHGYEMFQKSGDIKVKLIQFMLRPPVVFMNREASVVFSYGGEITSIIEKMGVEPERIVNIPSGIDDEWIVQAPKQENGKRRFLFIGRNERRKGIDELLRCRGIISESGSEFHWVGPIPEQKQLDSESCIYHGEIRDSKKLRDIIDHCHVLVTPSHSEGMPNVILEGMARGLAVIATRVGAVPALVDEENGYLIEPLKQSELKSALREMNRISETELTAMREASIARVKEGFRWSAVAEETLRAIEKTTHNISKVRE
ncbi:MAG: glycosyltransferase family 4 protein [Cryomorphaceae bacterium]